MGKHILAYQTKNKVRSSTTYVQKTLKYLIISHIFTTASYFAKMENLDNLAKAGTWGIQFKMFKTGLAIGLLGSFVQYHL